MKKLFLLSALFGALSSNTQAAVINVSNSPTAPVNPPHTYNNLQTAINSAADGDSLYVHGTNIDYGTITITNKTLVLIGAGYGNNLQSNFQQKSFISSIAFAGFTGTKNVVLVGLYLPSGISTSAPGAPVNNLVIERCGLNRISSESNNLIIKQSILETGGSDNNSIFIPTVTGNAIIQNSVLSGNVGGGSVNSSLWENNIFKKINYYYQIGGINSYNGSAIFNNNIFNSGYSIAVANCNFNNCIFYGTTQATVAGGGNLSTNCIFNTDPAFVSNGYLNSYSAIEIANYSTVVDYRLAAGSPCIGTGIGGTDMGIYGGVNALPATNNLNGVPAMPRITEMNVQNMSVAPNGNLNVQIKAVKEN